MHFATRLKHSKIPVLFDGKGWDNEIAQMYQIGCIPRTILIDKEGIVVRTLSDENLEEKIEKILDEK